MPIEINIIHKIDPRQFKTINLRMKELREEIEKFLEILEKFISGRI